MIELACIADAKYLRHTGAMLHSVLARTAPGTVSINVLHADAIDDREQRRLHDVTDGRALRLRFMSLPPDALADLPRSVFAPSIWLRIFLPELLGESDRVLYLDSDLIVTDDLAPLWETTIGDQLVGAVTNPIYPFMRPHFRLDLGIDRAQDYFNSGVLLMNLERMRREDFTNQVREFARARPGLGAPDQDALNVMCRNRWLKLHPRWNVQSTLFELKPAQLPLAPEQVAEALAAPAVIHYIGPSKPWHYLCTHPRRSLYFVHARATPWGEPSIVGRSLRNRVLRQLPLAWTYRWAAAERAMRLAWNAAR
jgi:lipopolysaccharide biosynthesis glycosyltransferase